MVGRDARDGSSPFVDLDLGPCYKQESHPQCVCVRERKKEMARVTDG